MMEIIRDKPSFELKSSSKFIVNVLAIFDNRYLATIGLVGYVCAYSFSFGPVTWVILSEIFPAATKGRAMAFTTSFNWLGNFIVSATFLQATRKKYTTRL